MQTYDVISRWVTLRQATDNKTNAPIWRRLTWWHTIMLMRTMAKRERVNWRRWSHSNRIQSRIQISVWTHQTELNKKKCEDDDCRLYKPHLPLLTRRRQVEFISKSPSLFSILKMKSAFIICYLLVKRSSPTTTTTLYKCLLHNITCLLFPLKYQTRIDVIFLQWKQ